MHARILMINGHPDSLSYCSALFEAYRDSASANSVELRTIELSKLSFNPNLQHGYRQRTSLEPDLIQAQELIQWADHLVIVYPTWWGSMPAILKGFFDRILLPGFAFKYRPDSVLWDKLLTGKSAHLIITTDTPAWYNWLRYRQAGHIMMKRNILQFCGITPVRITEIGPIKNATDQQRSRWLDKARQLGRSLA